MTPVSKFALAVALGAFSMLPAAHAADEKDKPKAEAPKQAFSEGFVKTFGPYTALDSDKDAKGKPLKPEKYQENLAKAKSIWPQLKAAATSDDDKVEAARFGVNVGLGLKDDALVKEAIDLALSSATLPADRRANYTYFKGDQAYKAKDYATATPLLLEAYNAGYRRADFEYVIALSHHFEKKYAESDSWMGKALAAKAAANQPIPALWYAVAGEAASHNKDIARTNSYYAQMVAAENKPNYWFAALETYRATERVSGEPLLDLLRLMRRTGSIDASNYERLIESLNNRRYPVEAEAALNEGVQKGKLKVENFANVTKWLNGGAKAEFIASLPEVEANARSGQSGYPAMMAGDDLFANGDYAKARDMYALALSRGPVKATDGTDLTAQTTLRLGISKLEAGDAAGAKAEFAKVTGASFKPIANYWAIYAGQI